MDYHHPLSSPFDCFLYMNNLFSSTVTERRQKYNRPNGLSTNGHFVRAGDNINDNDNVNVKEYIAGFNF